MRAARDVSPTIPPVSGRGPDPTVRALLAKSRRHEKKIELAERNLPISVHLPPMPVDSSRSSIEAKKVSDFTTPVSACTRNLSVRATARRMREHPPMGVSASSKQKRAACQHLLPMKTVFWQTSLKKRIFFLFPSFFFCSLPHL